MLLAFDLKQNSVLVKLKCAVSPFAKVSAATVSARLLLIPERVH